MMQGAETRNLCFKSLMCQSGRREIPRRRLSFGYAKRHSLRIKSTMTPASDSSCEFDSERREKKKKKQSQRSTEERRDGSGPGIDPDLDEYWLLHINEGHQSSLFNRLPTSSIMACQPAVRPSLRRPALHIRTFIFPHLYALPSQSFLSIS